MEKYNSKTRNFREYRNVRKRGFLYTKRTDASPDVRNVPKESEANKNSQGKQ